MHEASDNGGTIEPLEGLDGENPSALDPVDLDARLALPFPKIQEVETASDSGTLTLAFNGSAMSPDGPKQKLESTLTGSEGKKDAALDPILARIYLARPDLRMRMESLGMIPAGAGKELDLSTVGPLFADDARFEKQVEWMGYYGDFSADSSYTIVRAPLNVGGSFRHQLSPSLSDDVWEYGWLAGRGEVVTDAGTFYAVRIVYLIDFGERDIIDEQGSVIGTFHGQSIALLALSPGVGPVYQRGYDKLSPPVPELGIDAGVFFHEMSLIDYELR